jgi:ketosteroid isomerase-like protein
MARDWQDAVHDIEQLKFRYARALDLKDWDEFAATLTEDVTASYGDKLTFTGRDEVVGFMRNSLGRQIITVHHVHHPEIAVSADTATGTWYLQDTVLIPQHRMLLRGAAFYADRYVRGPDGWRIAQTGYTRSYESTETLPDSWQLTANRFAATG